MIDAEEEKLKDKNETAIMHQINSNSDIIAKKI
ncbi:hypothetical protein PMEL1_00343 [Prevotella melaninogenica]|uniref:Uncharacterized protein n=1 Tax=Prevotella melaninogenica TaxID=28132 RepID=A0A250KFQ4_9BACT|nr:hypothetical protein PMEL1_00343 [Prevotella melaninogenica]